MADGAADQFRSTFLRLTGGGQACTVTLAPNTLSHTWIMRNETAAALTLTQGSGANVAIAAGQTKIVATDGLGSGAVVYEMDDLELAGNLLVGGTLGVTGVLTATSLDISGDIDVDGTSNLDVVDIDGAVNMATTALVTGVLTTTAATVFNGGFASNAASTISTADNLDTLSLISTDADANVAPNLRMYRNSASPADNDQLGKIQLEGRNDNSQDVIYGELGSQIIDASDGTEDGRVFINTIVAGASVSRIDIRETELVINNESKDLDFRVESDGNINTLFVDGGTNNVGIGTGAPFLLSGNAAPGLVVASNGPFIVLQDANNANSCNYIANNSGVMQFGLNADDGGTKVEIAQFGTFGAVFNENSLDLNFRVESNGNANMLFVDGGNNAVGIGTATAGNSTLEVRSTGVDGTFANAIGFQYSGNASEANTISTAVSSNAAQSGMKFNISDGGGSAGKTNVATFLRNQIIFNDDSNDQDFRVESNNDANALFVDGADGTTTVRKLNLGVGGGLTGEGAISVGTSATNITSANDFGALVIVAGNDSGAIFSDLVFFATTVGATVVTGGTVSGGPTSRTYSVVSSKLKLAMASGTYSVKATAFRGTL